jgi:N-acetylglutamate synthase-like GNAT family acetyltransferase
LVRTVQSLKLPDHRTYSIRLSCVPTMAEPLVRQAADSDLPVIVEDYARGNTSPLNPFTSVDRLRQIPLRGLLVAEVDGKYAGFLYWYVADNPITDSNVGKYAGIAVVHVKKEFWKTTTGLRLLAHATKDIDREGISAIYTDASNNSLLGLFESAGFATFARTQHLRFLYPEERNRKQRSRDEARELAVFMVEAREQCRAFMTTYHDLMETLRIGPPTLDAEGQRVFSAYVWSRLQAALASCGVISKILWPQKTPKSDGSDKVAFRRGSSLRHILKLPAKNPFPTAVRNAFEHVDDKLSEWLPEQEEDIPLGWSLSPYADKEEPEPRESSKAFRYFNMVTMELRVADARCNLKDVMEEVRKIVDKMPQDAQEFFGRLKSD